MKLSAVIAIWIVAVAEAAVVPTKHREILAKNSPLHNRSFQNRMFAASCILEVRMRRLQVYGFPAFECLWDEGILRHSFYERISPPCFFCR